MKNANSPAYTDMSCHVIPCHVMSFCCINSYPHTPHWPSLLFFFNSPATFPFYPSIIPYLYPHPYPYPYPYRLTSFLIILTLSLLKLIPTHRLVSNLPANDQEVYRLLKLHMSNKVAGSAYNWVRPSLWSALFSSKDRDKEK